jgi:ABC-type multidrug transport system ATPase subunit
MQDDALLPTLSVRETLKYAYELRVSQKKSERDGCVTSILEMLGLQKVADSLVGDPLKRGISGGERRRLSIGVLMLDML